MRAWLRAKSWAVCVLAGGVLAFVTMNSAFAQGDPVAGDAKAAVCKGCHGEDGNSPVADFPRLAGQFGGYIVKQVRDFQTGHRDNNPIMTGMAATVASVQDAKDIGAFFQTKQMVEPITSAPGRDVLQQGERLYREGNAANGVYGCINCHGEGGQGRSPTISQFPVIGRQHRDYIIKQLNDFRSGTRKNDPAGMMTDIARKMTEDEITAVSEYLANLKPAR